MDNKIILNSSKTKTIYICYRETISGNFIDQKLNVLIQEEKVEEVNSQKLLGTKFYWTRGRRGWNM